MISKRNPYNGRLINCIIDEKQIRDESIFMLPDDREKIIIIRLDVAESLLRRGIKDFCLEQMEVCK